MTRFRDRDMALHDAAIAAAGSEDFGDDEYHHGLAILLDAIDAGPPLDANGEAAATGLIVGALTGRLVTQAGWNARPEALSAPIVSPLIVIGLPRTGTTALHQLLALDPQFQGIERWLTGHPIVRPPRAEWEADPRYRATVDRIAAMRDRAPAIMAAHSAEADEVDECLMPMAQSFTSNWFASNLDVPDYDRWFRSQDETASFARYKALIGLVGLGDTRRWLLKNPSHLFGIDALLTVFPDACIVQTHRHPAQSIASLTSLLGGIREVLAGQPIDRGRLQRRECDFWAEAARRGMTAQDRQPDRFVNVRQADIRHDPMAVVHRIYRHFGLTLSPIAERRMRAWADANPPHAESGHRYAPVASDAAVAEAFAPYIERYGL